MGTTTSLLSLIANYNLINIIIAFVIKVLIAPIILKSFT